MEIKVDLNTALSMIEPEKLEQNREWFVNVFNEADKQESENGSLSLIEMKYFFDKLESAEIDMKIEEMGTKREELVKQEQEIEKEKLPGKIPEWVQGLSTTLVALGGTVISICASIKCNCASGFFGGLFLTALATAMTVSGTEIAKSPYHSEENLAKLKELAAQKSSVDSEIAQLENQRANLPMYSNISATNQRVEELEKENARLREENKELDKENSNLKAIGTAAIMNN